MDTQESFETDRIRLTPEQRRKLANIGSGNTIIGIVLFIISLIFSFVAVIAIAYTPNVPLGIAFMLIAILSTMGGIVCLFASLKQGAVYFKLEELPPVE